MLLELTQPTDISETSKLNISGITVFSRWVSIEEHKITQERQIQLEEILQIVNHLVVCTGNPQKRLEFLDFIYQITGQRLNEEQVSNFPVDPEPIFNDATAVAFFKAIQPFLLRPDLFDATQVASAGFDVGAFVQNQSGLMVPSHQLGREGVDLTSEQHDKEYEQVKAKLVDRYCHPPEGQLKLIWDVGSFIINGERAAFTDYIEVISDPVDQELLEQYLEYARFGKEKHILTTNVQMKALECLIDNGKLKSIAFLPKEMIQRGFTFEDVRQTPSKELLIVALLAVVRNMQPTGY